MPISILCSGCHSRLNAPDAAAGKVLKCPKCKGPITVPQAAAPCPFEVVDDPDAAQSEPVVKPEKKGAPKKRIVVVDEVEDETDRPRKKVKSRRTVEKNRTKSYAMIAAAVVLVVGGVVVAVVASGGKDKKETVKGDPPGKDSPVPSPKPNPPVVSPPAVTPPDGTPPDMPTPGMPPVRPINNDVFARAATFKAEGPLPELPPLPPREKRPLLLLNPGGHTAFIRGVHITPNSDRVITVSTDKTVRVWDMASGEILSIYNLPAGPAEEGMLQASALSKSGKRLAVSGFPLGGGKEGIPIYILSVETGRLENVILGASNAVHSLDFSPDESLIAAGCADGVINGFETKTGKPAFTANHTGVVRQVKFHPKLQRLASIGSENAVALWDMASKDKPILSIMQMPEAGPNSIAWSSDGATLAIGCTSGEVHLTDAAGKPKRILPKATEKNAPIQVVRLEFLPGDRELVYGGIAYKGWAGIIDVQTGDRRIQFTEHTNTVMAVTCSKDGQLALSAGGENNETYVWRTADGLAVRRFEGAGRSVWGVGWAKDGKSIAWGNTNRHGGDGLCAIEQALQLDAWQRGDQPNPPDFQRQVHDDGTYSIEIDGFYKFLVKEKGKPKYVYEAPKGNRIYSVTILPGKGIVVGASNLMLLLDLKSGEIVRRFSGDTGLTISLAPSPDGRYFISGSTDQTLRIWNPDQEEPVLSIFAAAREWLAWTPQGYYSCSAYGERLIAWQVNSGATKLPTIHPAVRFRASLYQPGLIKYLVPAGNLQLALAMAAKFERQQVAAVSVNDVLPPEVVLTAPAEGEVTVTEDVLTVRASATANGRFPVLAMRLIVDGRPFQGSAGIKRFAAGEKPEAEWKVPLSPGIHSLSVLAESAVSKGLSRPLVATRTGTEPPPNLYVLAVGVSDYPGSLKLRFAASDAELLKKAFTENCKGVFGKIEVKVVTNKSATKKGILEGLDWLASKMTAKDVGVCSFSGHGTKDEKGAFYLVPVDVSLDDPDGTCLSGEEFKKRLENMPGRLVAILDACHSGAVAEAQMRNEAGKVDNLVRDLLTDDYGVVVMCASLGREYAIESPETQAGFFTLGLVEGLGGKADVNKDGVIFIHELDFYAGLRVNQLSGGRQNPVTGRPPTIRPFAMAKP